MIPIPLLQRIVQHRSCNVRGGLIIVGCLCASFFALSRGMSAENVVHGSKGFREISTDAATQSAAGPKRTGELPKGLWKAVVAAYKVNVDQVELISLRDLDGDGKDDAIVKILGDSCGSCGCSAAVFRKESDDYRLISDINCVREIAVDKRRTNGWLDLLSSSREGYFRLAFDGRSYPVSPLEGKPEKKSNSK